MFDIFNNKKCEELITTNRYLLGKVNRLKIVIKAKDSDIARLEKIIEELHASKPKPVRQPDIKYQPQRRLNQDPSRYFQEPNVIDDPLVVNTNGTLFGEVLVKE